MLNYDAVRQRDFGRIVHTYSQRDTMLYALGLGMGADPLDEGELRFVYEKELQAVPTMATVLGSPGFWWKDPAMGADWVKLVHGEQDLQLFQPLPAAATIVAVNASTTTMNQAGAGGKSGVVTGRTESDTAPNASTMVTQLSHAKLPDATNHSCVTMMIAAA